ncbi:hypothetical protein OYC64_006325 [Pagothenia borchgrevinki]|uniref:Uncharacterized protein n=1 Tax=Pagothenia borchgrevinki TaxID=8213 RepID=A0ABD2GIY0_PAGBO
MESGVRSNWSSPPLRCKDLEGQ